MQAAALPPGRNRQEGRHGKAPPVHLHERRTRRPNRRSPALNRPRPKWKPSCESRLSTSGRGKLPWSAESSTASRSRNDGGRRKNRDSAWSAAYRVIADEKMSENAGVELTHLKAGALFTKFSWRCPTEIAEGGRRERDLRNERRRAVHPWDRGRTGHCTEYGSPLPELAGGHSADAPATEGIQAGPLHRIR